jgi:hypothetical protein
MTVPQAHVAIAAADKLASDLSALVSTWTPAEAEVFVPLMRGVRLPPSERIGMFMLDALASNAIKYKESFLVYTRGTWEHGAPLKADLNLLGFEPIAQFREKITAVWSAAVAELQRNIAHTLFVERQSDATDPFGETGRRIDAIEADIRRKFENVERTTLNRYGDTELERWLGHNSIVHKPSGHPMAFRFTPKPAKRISNKGGSSHPGAVAELVSRREQLVADGARANPNDLRRVRATLKRVRKEIRQFKSNHQPMVHETPAMSFAELLVFDVEKAFRDLRTRLYDEVRHSHEIYKLCGALQTIDSGTQLPSDMVQQVRQAMTESTRRVFTMVPKNIETRMKNLFGNFQLALNTTHFRMRLTSAVAVNQCRTMPFPTSISTADLVETPRLFALLLAKHSLLLGSVSTYVDPKARTTPMIKACALQLERYEYPEAIIRGIFAVQQPILTFSTKLAADVRAIVATNIYTAAKELAQFMVDMEDSGEFVYCHVTFLMQKGDAFTFNSYIERLQMLRGLCREFSFDMTPDQQADVLRWPPPMRGLNLPFYHIDELISQDMSTQCDDIVAPTVIASGYMAPPPNATPKQVSASNFTSLQMRLLALSRTVDAAQLQKWLPPVQGVVAVRVPHDPVAVAAANMLFALGLTKAFGAACRVAPGERVLIPRPEFQEDAPDPLAAWGTGQRSTSALNGGAHPVMHATVVPSLLSDAVLDCLAAVDGADASPDTPTSVQCRVEISSQCAHGSCLRIEVQCGRKRHEYIDGQWFTSGPLERPNPAQCNALGKLAGVVTACDCFTGYAVYTLESYKWQVSHQPLLE